MWDRMQDPLGVAPRRPDSTATHVEVYLPQQVMVVFRDDRPLLITHISSGSNQRWCEVVTVDKDDGTEEEKGVCGHSITPGGVFTFNRRYDGWRDAELGRMWNPVYFNYGIAVHGAGNVPQYPASHGCVRIPMHIGNYFPSLVAKGDQIFVFRRREGAGGVRRPGAAVQHAGPELHDHHVDDDHDHHDDAAATDPAAGHTGAHPPSAAAADAGPHDDPDHGGSGWWRRGSDLYALRRVRRQSQPLTAGLPLRRSSVNAAMSPKAAVSTDTWSVPGYTVREALTPVAQ
jgi:hypothetical protein